MTYHSSTCSLEFDRGARSLLFAVNIMPRGASQPRGFFLRAQDAAEYPLAIRSSARRSRLDAYFARWRVTVLLVPHKVQASRRRSKPRVPPSARVTTLACAGTDKIGRAHV